MQPAGYLRSSTLSDNDRKKGGVALEGVLKDLQINLRNKSLVVLTHRRMIFKRATFGTEDITNLRARLSLLLFNSLYYAK